MLVASQVCDPVARPRFPPPPNLARPRLLIQSCCFHTAALFLRNATKRTARRSPAIRTAALRALYLSHLRTRALVPPIGPGARPRRRKRANCEGQQFCRSIQAVIAQWLDSHVRARTHVDSCPRPPSRDPHGHPPRLIEVPASHPGFSPPRPNPVKAHPARPEAVPCMRCDLPTLVSEASGRLRRPRRITADVHRVKSFSRISFAYGHRRSHNTLPWLSLTLPSRPSQPPTPPTPLVLRAFCYWPLAALHLTGRGTEPSSRP